MKELTKRVEQLEKDTHQIRIDVATLTERSNNYVTKAEFNGKLHDFEVRLNERLDGMDKRMDQRFEKMDQRFEKMDERCEKMDERHLAMITRLDAKVDSIGSKIFWGIFFPGMTVAIGWFIRNAVMT